MATSTIKGIGKRKYTLTIPDNTTNSSITLLNDCCGFIIVNCVGDYVETGDIFPFRRSNQYWSRIGSSIYSVRYRETNIVNITFGETTINIENKTGKTITAKVTFIDDVF